MATYLDREQVRHRRAIQRRYDADQERMALLIAFLLSQYARIDFTGKRTIPTDQRTRLAIKAAIWAQVLRPYYIGQGTEPFSEAVPQSPFATLVRDGIDGAMRIQVQRQQNLVQRYIKDAVALAWLFSPGQSIQLPEVKQPTYQQPFYAYVDSNGYRLNDRIERNAIDSRTRITGLVDYHISQGMDTAGIGEKLTNFMTISGRATGKPYGDYGSYAPWRGLRGEMVLATGRATVIASMLNPVVDKIWWRVSPAHSEPDACDANASGGPNGDGIYPIDDYPRYPNHPGEACSLIPVAAENMKEITDNVLQQIRANSPTAQFWHGTMNEDSLIRALMTDETRARPQPTDAERATILNRRDNVRR